MCLPELYAQDKLSTARASSEHPPEVLRIKQAEFDKMNFISSIDYISPKKEFVHVKHKVL